MDLIIGKIIRSIKILIYGIGGIGKSTIASYFPDPVFIDLEGGTTNLDVKRIPKPPDWKELLKKIKEISVEKPVSSRS